MKNNFKNFGIVILAAGQGKRLNCAELPKVLFEIGGSSVISYILEVLQKNGIKKNQIVLVVGFKADLVKEKIGAGYIYALQTKRLGTAHATMTGEKVLPENFTDFLILNSDDSAFYKFASLADLTEFHLSNNNDISLLTCEPDNPQGLGRVARGQGGKVIKIVEKENMTPDLEQIREISTGTFCFNRAWFKNHYLNLKPIAGLGEYGLPSLVEEALKTGSKFGAVKLTDPNEWFGINTPEQLAEADRRKKVAI